jgi:DNA-binding XRE family transcriptional regulator
LKLASGMTNAGRLKDLSDVLELIKILNLPADFTDRLNPFVRTKYLELWNQGKKRYEMLWRNKWLTSEAKTFDEMIESLRSAAHQLDEMRDAIALAKFIGGLRQRREKAGLSLTDVADRSGIDKEALSRLENGFSTVRPFFIASRNR